MSEVYIYEANATNCDSIGLCGALEPIECKYTEIANGMASITLTQSMDRLGKYLNLTEGRIIKAFVPVRTTPELENGAFIEVVEVWRVKAGATANNRKIWSKQEGGKCVYTLAVGNEVNVVSAPETSDRWKVTHTYIKTVKKSGKYIQQTVTVTGWMVHDASTLEDTEETVVIPPTVTGIETVAPSWKMTAQLFRITSVSKGINEVNVEAQHISYDMMYNLTTYDEDGQKTITQAISGVLGACLDSGNVCSVRTNLTGTKTGFHFANKDPITALLDPESGLVTRWGGQVVRNNEDIVILDNAGTNRGMVFRYGDNINGIDVKVDMANASTAIRPYGELEDGKPVALEYSYTLDENYENPTVISGDTRGIVLSPRYTSSGVRTVPFERIYALQGEDCTENKKDGPNVAEIRTRLLNQAIKALKDGADMPETSVDVDIAILGHSDRYAEYRDLEQVFLFDTVRVRHPQMAIDMYSTVSEIEWDCINDRLLSIKLGAIQDLQASVASWQISSVSGGKIQAGTISAQSLGNDCISARTIITDSVTADAISANAIVSDKIATKVVQAVQAEINTLTADMVDSHEIDADTINAALAAFEYVKASSFEATESSIKLLIAETGITEQATINKLYAQYLQVQNLLAANATFGRVVIKGTDGNYYRVNIDSSGTITTTQVTISSTEAEAGYTSTDRTDGLEKRQIIEDTAIYQQLSTRDFKAANGIIDALTAQTIHTDTLFAREATITSLKSAVISSRDGNPLLFSDLVNDYRDGMLLGRDQASQVVYVDIGQLSAGNKARISQDGFKVIVQGQTYSHLGSNFVQFGNYQIRKSADGGMVFKLKEGV